MLLMSFSMPLLEIEMFFMIGCVLGLAHQLAQNNDKNIQTDLIITDFAKAFDKVPHSGPTAFLGLMLLMRFSMPFLEIEMFVMIGCVLGPSNPSFINRNET
jgi:hypothetical protein